MSRHHPSPAIKFTHDLVRCQVLLKYVQGLNDRGAKFHVHVGALREVRDTLIGWLEEIETGRVVR